LQQLITCQKFENMMAAFKHGSNEVGSKLRREAGTKLRRRQQSRIAGHVNAIKASLLPSPITDEARPVSIRKGDPRL